MASVGYSLIGGAGTPIALTADTARTVLGILAPSQFGLDIQEFGVGFDGIVAGARPVYIELCQASFATKAPGTGGFSTSIASAIRQERGVVIAHGITAAEAWTAGNEPTVLAPIRAMRIHPQSQLIFQVPLGQTWDCAASLGFAIRITAHEAVNVYPHIVWERI